MQPYITIEGPIGVGKTTLTNLLSQTYNLEPVFEVVDQNPFLADFYTDIERYALQTEMFFLLDRFKQLENLFNSSSMFNGVISDYHIIKNYIFAKMNLSSSELSVFEPTFNAITSQIKQPQILIHLTADISILNKRIAKRNRSFESAIENRYLERLTKNYNNTLKNFAIQKNIHYIFLDTSYLDLTSVSSIDFLNLKKSIDIIFNQSFPDLYTI